jgi:hypothetical protein
VIREILFAAGVVLASSADWELVSPSRTDLPPICATDQETCEAAVAAIRSDHWSVDRAYVECRPRPLCRELRDGHEDCIRGFNCHE